MLWKCFPHANKDLKLKFSLGRERETGRVDSRPIPPIVLAVGQRERERKREREGERERVRVGGLMSEDAFPVFSSQVTTIFSLFL